jgi:acyl-coenzyme A thioesterase PaaI-like protein
VTDVPADFHMIPSRLGVSFRLDGEHFVGILHPPPALCERGVVPAAAIVYLTDVVTGVPVDQDPDAWLFTSELSVRAPLARPPASIESWSTTLRAGRRSVTCEAPLLVDGVEWGSCFAGFSRVPRREGESKIEIDTAGVVARGTPPPLDMPLRAAAGFETLDSARGVVTADLRFDLLNPAGALQGAMVAGLAEAAAEDLADHHRALGTDRHVVTEMEIRYLAQNRVSPIVTEARFVGPPSEGLVRVNLIDDGARGRLGSAILARVRPAPV